MAKRKNADRGGTAGLAAALFLLMMARACAFGARYYPQLDDYIQYHNYSTAGSFQALQESTGLLASRPLAGLADYFVWGRMFDHMILGVALVSALYVAAALMIWRLLGRYFRVSPVLPVIMVLLPLNMEGTYWMSASTRVAVGMFFAALAAWTFLGWLDRGGGGRLAFYLGLQLIPFGFYEQAGILSVTLTVGAAILEWTMDRRPFRRCALSLWGGPALGLYFLFTHLMAAGNVYSGRAEIILPISRYYWKVFFPDIAGQLRDAFLKGGFFTLAKGFVRGGRLVLSGQLALWALGVLALCALLWFSVRRQGTQGRGGTGTALLAGVLLWLGPVSLFLILSNPWFSLRGAVTSLPGLALVADTLLQWLWDRLSLRQEGIAGLAAAAALVFCVAGASETADYRDTYENDQHIAGLVLETLAEDGVDRSSGRVGVLNLEASYLPNQNFFWHEHIHGCTESAWAFSGLLTARAGEGCPSVAPLPSDPMYRQWNREANHPASFDVLYWFDGGALTRAELKELGENRYEVTDRSGRTLGRIVEEDGIGYIRPQE